MVTSLGSLGQTATIEDLISQYMAIERRPVETLQTERSELSVRSAMFTDIQTKIEEIKNLAEDLSSTSDSAFDAVKVTCSDTATLTATGAAESVNGTYSITVDKLATTHRVQSLTPPTDWTSGAVPTIFAVNGALIKLDAGATLTQLAAAINGADYATDKEVVATVIGGRLVLESKATGTGAAIQVADYVGSVCSNLGVATTTHTAVAATAGEWQGDPATGPWTREIDLGGPQTVNRLEWSRDLSGVATDGVPKDYTIEYLDAGGNWQALLAETGNTLAAGASKEDAFTAVTTAKLRINVTATNDGTAPTMDSLAVYADTFASFDQPVLQAPENGQVTVNGVVVGGLTRNTGVTDVVQGLTLDFKAEAGPVTVTVADDTAGVRGKITAFLDKINSFVGYLKAKSAVTKGADGNYTRGILNGNSLFTGLASGLISELTRGVDGLAAGDPTRLAQIGIELNADLQVKISDASKLDDWLQNDPNAVAALFGGANGVAKRIFDRLEPFVVAQEKLPDATYTPKSYVQAELDGILTSQDAIDDRIAMLNERLADKEVQLRAQFTRLQEMMLEVTMQQSNLAAFMSVGSSLVSY